MCCSLAVPLNCDFRDSICDYIVSNTSTNFAFFYVFSIDSLGKLI